jgi:hypothetical protein
MFSGSSIISEVFLVLYILAVYQALYHVPDTMLLIIYI